MMPLLPDLKTVPIVAVDDEPVNLKLLDKMLRAEGYSNVILLDDPRAVLPACREHAPGVILLDLNMPRMDGYAVMRELGALEDPPAPPVIVLTAQLAQEFLVRAFDAGARDYVVKPFDRIELMARVRNLLEAHRAQQLLDTTNGILERAVRERTDELQRTRLQIVRRLGRAAEYRDNETGNHVLRMSKTAALLARRIGWSPADCELMLQAAPMHDVGKIGVPDEILLKRGALSPAEWTIMQRHTEIGADILDDESDLLSLARNIAASHHEKWDGSGYPLGLKGEAIPQEGRIAAVADVFDALTSERPYKKAWPVPEAIDYICDQTGRHFDPAVVEAFQHSIAEILKIREAHAG